MQRTTNFMSILSASILFIPAGREGLYLDPGSGSFIIQIIIAAIAGMGYAFRFQIKRYFGLFGRDRKQNTKKQK